MVDAVTGTLGNSQPEPGTPPVTPERLTPAETPERLTPSEQPERLVPAETPERRNGVRQLPSLTRVRSFTFWLGPRKLYFAAS